MKPEDFPSGTEFFIKGIDVPVAILPNGKASSWFGGWAQEWSDDHLKFSRFESTKKMVEVSFVEFEKIVAKSVIASTRPAVSHDDFMYCRPDEDGIWRDSDGDPI